MATFVRVIDAGSLSSAARSLNMSLAAVSRQVGALEKETGASLLVRTTRKHSVTEAGRRYYVQCVRVLREVDAAQASVRPGGMLEGALTISVPVTLGLERIFPHVRQLLTRHAGLRVDIRFEDRLADIVGEGVDVAIRGGGTLPESTSFISRRLLTYHRIVVASPSYIKRRGEPKTPDELADHDALLHVGASTSTAMWRFRRGDEESSVKVGWTFRTNLVYALREAALAGLGVAQVADWLVARDIAEGRLKVLLPEYVSPPLDVCAVYRRELRNSARIRAFLGVLSSAYATEMKVAKRG
ncbi:MAG TPA: LysR family transcriptional regulator [Kofleriaceae bacterium]